MMHYVSWRNGRPRFAPSARERALGFKGRDLRHPSGEWFTLEQAETFARETYATIVAARGDRERRPRVLREGARRNGSGLGYVYFLWAGDEIKIGFSTGPLSRVGTLRTAMAREPSALVAVRASKSHERDLHSRLSRWRTRGEWFQAVPEVMVEMFDALRKPGKIG